MQNHRTHYFNDATVITGLLPTGEFGAYRDDEDEGYVRGFGHSRLAAIADLNEAISKTDEEYDHRAAAWDHALDHRKNWVA